MKNPVEWIKKKFDYLVNYNILEGESPESHQRSISYSTKQRFDGLLKRIQPDLNQGAIDEIVRECEDIIKECESHDYSPTYIGHLRAALWLRVSWYASQRNQQENPKIH